MTPEEQDLDDRCLLACVALAPLNGRCPADPRMRNYRAYRRLVDAGLGYFEDGEFVAGEKKEWRFIHDSPTVVFRDALEDWLRSVGVPVPITCALNESSEDYQSRIFPAVAASGKVLEIIRQPWEDMEARLIVAEPEKIQQGNGLEYELNEYTHVFPWDDDL